MATIDTYEGDSLNVIILVKEDGAAKDITGATVTAELRRADGLGSDIAGTTSLPDAPGGSIGVSWTPGAIPGPTSEGTASPLEFRLHCRVVLGPESQVVSADTIRVKSTHV